VLARLEKLDGIERAETDFGGDYLRLHLRSQAAVPATTELLLALGYLAEPTDSASVTRWYGRDEVGELSRVEAGVIADRVVTKFREVHPLPEKIAALREAVTDALHRCFVTTALTSAPSLSLRTSCTEATRDAAAPLIGAELASELAALIETDMSEDHKTASPSPRV
jgi:hypothetical protein